MSAFARGFRLLLIVSTARMTRFWFPFFLYFFLIDFFKLERQRYQYRHGGEEPPRDYDAAVEAILTFEREQLRRDENGVIANPLFDRDGGKGARGGTAAGAGTGGAAGGLRGWREKERGSERKRKGKTKGDESGEKKKKALVAHSEGPSSSHAGLRNAGAEEPPQNRKKKK